MDMVLIQGVLIADLDPMRLLEMIGSIRREMTGKIYLGKNVVINGCGCG